MTEFGTHHNSYGESFFLRTRADDAVALVTHDGVFTVSQMLRASGTLARHLLVLRDSGGRVSRARRPRLLLPSSNAARFMAGLFACSMAGVTAVPWREDALSLAFITQTVRPDAILQSGKEIGDAALIKFDDPRIADERSDELIVMTSGSTGDPKGVALDFAQLALNATSAGSAIGIWRCSSWAINIDMSLMSAICHALMAWQFDLPFVHLKGIEKTDTASVLRNGFGFGGSPLQLIRLQEALADGLVPKIVASSGDFLTPAMIDAIAERYTTTEIHKLYGLTELGGRFCHIPHHELMQNKNAVGRPLPGLSARVATHTGTEIGEIEARSPLLTRGYYLPSGAFEPVTTEWFATGDLGTIDGDGIVTLVGRADDVFKVGGEKIDRMSIEAALFGIMKGRSYCVLPVEHHLLGLCPALFVEASPAQPAPAWQHIVAHVRQSHPARYVPTLMYAVEGELPRLPSGKLDRAALTSRHSGLVRLT